MKTCVLVVGMHRSGTSVMAGALRIMGVDFGEKLLGSNISNVKGHFEHTEILDVNNAILAAFGSSWSDPNPLPETWNTDPRIASHKKMIREIIARDFSGSELFGIKEPRVSILLPVYTEIVRSLSIEPAFVVMNRPSQEIAKSLYKRDKISSEQSIPLCRKYLDALTAFAAKEKAVHVGFDEILGAPKETLSRIESALCIGLKDFELVKNELFEFIDPGLKHFKSGKITPMTVKNRVRKVIDPLLRLHARQRKFAKNIVRSVSKKPKRSPWVIPPRNGTSSLR
jgi:hypothetical protein